MNIATVVAFRLLLPIEVSIGDGTPGHFEAKLNLHIGPFKREEDALHWEHSFFDLAGKKWLELPEKEGQRYYEGRSIHVRPWQAELVKVIDPGDRPLVRFTLPKAATVGQADYWQESDWDIDPLGISPGDLARDPLYHFYPVVKKRFQALL